MIESQHTLIIDGYNMIHRSRSGFMLGDWPVCFNFFRNFRATVEQFNPTSVLFVLEGHAHRVNIDSTYKANRKIDFEDPIQRKKFEDFQRQKTEIIKLLKNVFPISVVRHPEFEADDTIYNLIKNSSTEIPITLISNDSDFIQLLNEFDHVKIYNPVLKVYVEKPNYDYVRWKCLKGDCSDNIKGIPGVGDITATSLIMDEISLRKYFNKNPEAEQIYLNNYKMIKFFTFSEYELKGIENSVPKDTWDVLKASFEKWGFKSLLKESTWEKYIKTFDNLSQHSARNVFENFAQKNTEILLELAKD